MRVFSLGGLRIVAVVGTPKGNGDVSVPGRGAGGGEVAVVGTPKGNGDEKKVIAGTHFQSCRSGWNAERQWRRDVQGADAIIEALSQWLERRKAMETSSSTGKSWPPPAVAVVGTPKGNGDSSVHVWSTVKSYLSQWLERRKAMGIPAPRRRG